MQMLSVVVFNCYMWMPRKNKRMQNAKYGRIELGARAFSRFSFIFIWFHSYHSVWMRLAAIFCQRLSKRDACRILKHIVNIDNEEKVRARGVDKQKQTLMPKSAAMQKKHQANDDVRTTKKTP